MKRFKITLPLFAAGFALVALPAALANDSATMFKSMDTDGDGRVSRAEHAAGAKMMFDKMDANHDGVVTAAEMDAARPMKSEKPAGQQMSASEKIKVIDTDGDGQLTAAEHSAGSQTMFNKMDTNSDGFLSMEEFEAGHKKMMNNDK